MTSEHLISLRVVVNGVETNVKGNVNAPLRTVVEHALSQTQNQGRPISDWELRDVSGQVFEIDRKISSYNLSDGALLYLQPTVGVNGTTVLYSHS